MSAFEVTGFRLLQRGRVVELCLQVDGRQVAMLAEALNTAMGAVESELNACSDNGDQEGTELLVPDLRLIEELAVLVDRAAELQARAGHGYQWPRRAGTLGADSAGVEAPSHDAASTSSGNPLASPAAAPAHRQSGGGGATGAGGGTC